MGVNERLISEKKKQLRAVVRKRLALLSEAEIRDCSASICAQIRDILELRGLAAGAVVTSFAAFGPEPDLLDLHRLLPELQIAYPCCRGKGVMSFHIVNDPADLVPGRYGILEPEEGIPPVNVADIEVFLVPALAYDQAGERLGKGGGYYDRLLAKASNESFRIGIIFGCQRSAQIPVDGYDQSVDLVVTE